MFCQACGAANSADARFCNMCGARIAAPGMPGGPIPESGSPKAGAIPAMEPSLGRASMSAREGAGDVDRSTASPPTPARPAPSAESAWAAHDPESARENSAFALGDAGEGGSGAFRDAPSFASEPSAMGITLQRIGVHSSRRIWAFLALTALGLVGFGALGMWLVTRSSDGPEDAGRAEPDDPFVIGTPLPRGSELPEVDFVSGSGAGLSGNPASGEPIPARDVPGASSSGAAAPVRSGSPAAPSSQAKSTPAAASRSVASAAGTSHEATSSGGASSEVTSTGTARAGSSESTGKASVSGSAGATGASASDSGEGASGGASGSSVAELPPDRDIELDLYGARVRYAVQRYYAARAQSCFDRATRNNPVVRGTVVVSLMIGGEGEVKRSSVVRNTTGDSDLGACLAGQVASWRLPPPPGGELEMEMPFSR